MKPKQREENPKPFENAPPAIKRLATFLSSFYKDSDRGAALMAGSILDDVLKEIVGNFLVNRKESLDLIEGFNAPLGTFHSRVLAAYSLGLIEEQEFLEIETIRKIRNAFGHSWADVNFSNKEISRFVKQLPFKDENSRTVFNNSVANLLGELLWRNEEVKELRRVAHNWRSKNGFLKRL